MELNDFISSSLTELINGVLKAQENIKDTGAIINPKLSSGSTSAAGHT